MLRIELLGDGGIRVEPPAGAGGLASERMAREWIDSAAEQGDAVEITGETTVAVHAELVSYAARTTPRHCPCRPRRRHHGQTAGRRCRSLPTVGSPSRSSELAIARSRLGRRAAGRGRRTAWRCTTDTSTRSLPCASAGVAPPPGSRPPDDLPNAVVLRNYLPAFVRWVADRLCRRRHRPRRGAGAVAVPHPRRLRSGRRGGRQRC